MVFKSLQERVLRLIHREALIPEGGRVLVALSGGADSVALTLLMHELAPTGGFTFAGVLHLHHQLRRAADEDERFCRGLAEKLSLAIEVRRADVRGLARQEGISIEAAGHRERYAFFGQGADALHAERVATAHTQDDQGETYLMRLIRGAGPDGLAGIRPSSGRVIRPLLHVSRSELRAYLAGRGQSFREDETNKDLSVTRNRVRHELIPFLQEKFSPSIVDVLARAAAIARGDAEWLDAAVNEIAPTIVMYHEGSVSVDAVALDRQPPAVARRIARRALEHVAHRSVGFDHVERFLSLAKGAGREATDADFPGCRVERRGTGLTVGPPRPRSSVPLGRGQFSYELEMPGEVRVPEAGLVISAHPASREEIPETLEARGGTIAVAAGELSAPLIVRNWQPGDVVRPLGLVGRRKLQDFFVDRKVVRSERHRVPSVTDTRRGIVWVVGHTVADDFRVTPSTKGVLILKARKIGEAG